MADSKVIQDIMDNLQDTSETLMQVAADVATQAEALAEHNTAPSSHPYILQKLEDLDAVSMADLNDAISEHTNSNSAHASLITKIVNDTNTNIGDAIGDHNESATAHPAIRAVLTQLDNEMATVRNYKSYIELLDDLFGGSTSSVTLPAIENMENRLEVVEVTLNRVNNDLADLTPRVEDLEDSQLVQDHRLDSLESTVSLHTTEIASLKTRMTVAESKLSLLSTSDPNLMTLVHTVPAYVNPGSTYNVKFSGVIVPSGQTLLFDILNVTTGMTLSKVTGVAQDETITLTIGAGVARNTKLKFTLKANLSPSGDSNALVISTTTASLPDMSGFTVNGIGPNSVAGQAYDYTFTPATDAQGNGITYSVTSCSSGTCTINSANKNGVFTPAAGATPGTVVNIVFRATTANGYSEKTITTTIASNINVANLVSNHPTISKPNNSISIALSGATSSAGGIKYSIAPKSGSVITISPDTNILDGQNVTMSIPSNAGRGSTQTFVVTVTDANNATATKEFTMKINSLPIASNIVATGIPANANGGSALTVSFSGGSDADSQALTYNILNSNRSGVQFSKTTGIAAGENITVTLDYVSANATFSFDVKVTDSLGEISADAKTISMTILPVYIASTPDITYPTEGTILTSDAVTFVFSDLVVTTKVA